MSWNMETERYSVRLPVSDTDGPALLDLLGSSAISAHIPRAAMSTENQADDELRRMAMRFEGREAAFWLIEDKTTQQVIARIGIQYINWMMLNAQLQWELTPACDLAALREVLTPVINYLMNELHLQRLEMRQVHGTDSESLTELGFQFEGTLPAQAEFNGEDIDLDIYSLLAGEFVAD